MENETTSEGLNGTLHHVEVVQPVVGDSAIDADVHAAAVGVVFVLERDELPAVATPRVALARLDDEPGVLARVDGKLGHHDMAHIRGGVVDDDAALHLETCKLFPGHCRPSGLDVTYYWGWGASRNRFT